MEVDTCSMERIKKQNQSEVNIIHNTIHAANASRYIQNKRNDMDTIKNKIKDIIEEYVINRIDSLIEDLDSNEVRDDIIDELYNAGIELERDYTLKRGNTEHSSRIDSVANELAHKLAEYYINNRIETKQ